MSIVIKNLYSETNNIGEITISGIDAMISEFRIVNALIDTGD